MSKRIISVEETFAAHSRLTRQQLAQRMPPTQVVIVRPRKRQGKAVDAHAQTDRDGDGPSAADLIRASARAFRSGSCRGTRSCFIAASATSKNGNG